MLTNILSTYSSPSWPTSGGKKIHKYWDARKIYVVGYGEVENILLCLIFKENINFLNICALNVI